MSSDNMLSGFQASSKANGSGTKNSSRLFNELLETSKNLPSTSSDLGPILLSVNEMKKRAQEMRKTIPHESNHTKAHYLLAGSGLGIHEIENSLNNLKASELLSEQRVAQGYNDGDLDTYLNIRKDENILSAIEQSLSLAAKDFDNFVNQNFNLDWKQRKDEVRESFGILIKKRQDTSNYDTKNLAPLDPNSGSFWGKPGRGLLDGDSRLNVNENYIVREKFEKYARIIYRLNNARQSHSGDFELAKEFISTFQNTTDSKYRQLLEGWEIIDNAKGKSSVVDSSKKYLERQFLNYVDNLYSKNPSEGLPTNVNKIRAFIDMKLKTGKNTWKFNNLTIVNGIPVWALVFYLLRAGLPQDALEVVVNNKLSFKKVEQSFLTYFKAYVTSSDNRLPQEFVSRLHTEYNQHIKNALDSDPFRLAVYKIIGRCDLTRKNISAITLSVEDWLWVHLMLIKDDMDVDDPVYERYTLNDFQNTMVSYGESRFNNYYLQVLLLSGQYELAVQYAYKISEMDAVHLSIGLAYYNMLHVSTYKEDELISVTDGQTQLNFVKVLGNYTKSFKYSDPRIAVEYLILIALSNQSEQIELAYEALRELILETKEFTILLGKVNAEGIRIPGIVEERQSLLQLQDQKDFLYKITEQAARRADEEGRVQDSLLLYQLSEEYDIVMSIVNKLLGELLSTTEINQPLFGLDDNNETNPVLIAKRLIEVYINNIEISKKVQQKNKETCITLLKLVDIRSSFLARQWQSTLQKIEELDLIPFADENSTRKRAQEFAHLDENILKNIPNLLIITMLCISNIVKQLNESDYQSLTKKQQIDSLKRVAKNCMIYAGMIQYKMPRETYSILINIEVSL
ncbi:nucleoporin NIC96 [Kluyveromyces marxianus]|uniref:Nuclear pore protein n=1 Tax=Kluyveromyces marxianus TaxID=4911 RepID=A0ABX6F214_KLUMA|nr:nucleoporin NIC96 [Kluyveromyces marxianus]